MPPNSRKRHTADSRSVKRPSVNEVLRAAYRRFTRDEPTRRALNIFAPRPTAEYAVVSAGSEKPSDASEVMPGFRRHHLTHLPA